MGSNGEDGASSGGGSDRLPELGPDEVRLYGRHLILPQVGMEGQRRLKAGSVLVIGAGGLGSPALQYLAAAGVGRIGIVDGDTVDASNLHRQVLYSWDDQGRSKAEAARDRLLGINPHIQVDVHKVRFTSENALELAKDYDVILDGTDNFPTRYLTNDVCVKLGKPNVHASIFRFDGQASVFWPGKGPCYRCLFPAPPPPGLVPNCAEGGVLGVLPGLLGVVQATEAVKVLLGRPDEDLMVGRLLLYDALHMTFDTVPLQPRADCLCQGPREDVQLIDYEDFCGITAHEQAGDEIPEVSVQEAHDRLAKKEAFLLDVREPNEWEIVHIEGAKLIPLGELPQRLGDLPQERDILVHCKSGARSAQAVALLRQMGFQRVWNVAGGIDDWAVEVEPGMVRY